MKTLLLFGSIVCATLGFGQVNLFTDDFESGTSNWTLNGGSGGNSWVVNNSYTGYSTLIPNTPDQPAGIGGSPQSNYLHIVNGSICSMVSACNANFDTGSASNQNAELTTSVDATSYTNVTVSFWYLCAGQTGVSYGNLEYSLDGGTTWTSTGTEYSGTAAWTQETVSLTAWDNASDFKIRFKWQNGSSGSDPAFSIDDLVISGTPPAGGSSYCFVSVTPSDTVICPGDSVLISAAASVTTTGQSFNFDTGSLPPGWATTGSTVYATPCGPGPNGSAYFWAATSGSSTPMVTTAGYDVSCGGQVVFEMMYSVQGGASPCEGPDLENEGVELQYSTDGGVTWTTIVYYSPGGFELPSMPTTSGSVASGTTPYTTWNNFSATIPPGAMTTSTMFRWIQQNSSGSCCDNWGLENISIQGGPCNSAVVNWNNGLNDTTSFWAVPTGDTSFVAYVFDTLGVQQCTSDSINISFHTASLTYDLVDTLHADCFVDSALAEIVNQQGATRPLTFNWSNGETDSSVYLHTAGNPTDIINYYVTTTDACGFTYDDSVVLVVNQALNIDTTQMYTSTACLPDGAVSATVSNITGTPLYEWYGPGQDTTNTFTATVWSGLSPGWYYFSVTDDVCYAEDSVYLEPVNPPIAQMSASVTQGCGPLNIDFTNTSQNAINYEWHFGNSDPVVSTTTLDGQSASYLQSTTVQLVAFDNNGCTDTASVVITVDPCGCTDPSALNYNPLATTDNGSCIFPVPEVIVPNVFIPNSNGPNNMFYLTATNAVEIELTILNRWGNVLFQEIGTNPSWDGKSAGGVDASEGVYFYKYRAKGPNGDEVEGSGFLQLIRE